MEITKCGMIAIVGRPNVGKSTLTNALTGDRIAIVSPKPQTTRNRICGVVCRDDTQYVFMDTPGLHKAQSKLGEFMNHIVDNSVADVDAALLMVEPIAKVGIPERELIEKIKGTGAPAILVINKIDTVSAPEILPVIDAYRNEMEFEAVLPISAKNNDGIEELFKILAPLMPKGRPLFPEDMTTDQPERQVLAEILREKLLYCLDREVPHGIAVELETFSERENGIIDVGAVIYCEKTSHKGIIIGKSGAMLKRIGEQARVDMEKFMGTKICLKTWVKVAENWRDKSAALHNFGYVCDD